MGGPGAEHRAIWNGVSILCFLALAEVWTLDVGGTVKRVGSRVKSVPIYRTFIYLTGSKPATYSRNHPIADVHSARATLIGDEWR